MKEIKQNSQLQENLPYFSTFQEKIQEANHAVKNSVIVEAVDFPQYRGLSFKEFWYKINEELGVDMPYYDYEEELEQALIDGKYLWVKKSAGLGITEFMIRWIAWNCLKDDVWRKKQVDVNVILITGNRLDLAITIINRIKNLFKYNFKTKETVLILNGNKIQAFPSHHVAAAHGLNPVVVLLEEGDLFPPGQQDKAREVAERYIPKSDPFIIWVSTPYLPGGLYEKIEREQNSIYNKKIMLYERGLNKVYTPEAIAIAKLSPSFEREYNGKYGYGEGDIFPSILVEKCIKEYPLVVDGESVFIADPAYGSSMFGTMGMCKIDGQLKIIEAKQYDRPSPEVMTNLLVEKAKQYGKVIIDSAHPGLIRDLVDKGVNAMPVIFGAKVDPVNTKLSKMTMEAAQVVAEERVDIHPVFKDFIAQLMAVKFNEKGHPDKTQLTFDLGDCFLMGCDHLKSSKVTIIKV